MSDPSYLIIHKDHLLDVDGVNSGAEMATLFLARFLAKMGHRVVVAGILKDGEKTAQGVEHWDLGTDFNVSKILERARGLGTYHLISAGRAQAILESRNEACCLSRTLISHDRSGNDTGIKPDVLTRVADRVVCVSDAQREVFLTSGADPKKVTTVLNGVDLELFSPGNPETRDYKKLVFVGALIEDKGIHVLINSYVTLRQKYPGLSLDVYGSASLWGREPMFDEKKVEAQVPGIKFHGKAAQHVVAKAFQQSGICVVPSIWFDPFPLTSLEAQATGCPVVAFDVGGLREGIDDGKTGVVIRDINEKALTDTLDKLLSSPETLKGMAIAAEKHAREKFTWERVARTISALCTDAASARRHASPSVSLTRKKLGFLSTWNQECGLATYGRYLLQELEPDSYVVLGEKTLARKTRDDESYVVRCWTRGSSSFEELYRAIKEHDIGLLDLNCQSRFFAEPAFAEFLCKLRAEGIKVVARLHNVFTFENETAALVSSVDKVLVHCEESSLEVIANGGAPDKVSVVPHGVLKSAKRSADELKALRIKLGMPEGKILVACGFIQPHKGIEGLIEAIAYTRSRGLTTHGYVAGNVNPDDPHAAEYLLKLKDYARSLGVAQYVTFLERFISNDELSDYLAAADVVLMNYLSQHYEASGACSLAVGAGAVVATSTAPVFSAFGSAVWHITAGYPTPLSAEVLLQHTKLREALHSNAERYAETHSWPRIAQRLLSEYEKLGFVPTVVRKESTVQHSPEKKGSSALRVLMQNRPTTFTHRGGDTVLLEKLMKGLKSRGVTVDLDLDGKADPSNYDIVHIFNFALPELTEHHARRAAGAKTPFVVTTLCEDIPSFHNQSVTQAQLLIDYVRRGQDAAWFDSQRMLVKNVPPCARFFNDWTAANAARLFTNGSRESGVLRRDYKNLTNICEIKLGYEVGAPGSADEFIKAYGFSDFVLCVGRLESRKNQLMLLKALEDSEVPVVLASGGFSYQPEYEHAVRQFKRKGKTLVLNRLSPEMLANAYAAARVHVLPSWYELPGLVSLEAAYYGCNIVCTDKGTARDYFGDKAFYCDPMDEVSIFNAVTAAYNSPVAPGLKEIVMSNTWDNASERTLQEYQAVLAGRGVTTSEAASTGASVVEKEVTLGSTGADSPFLKTLEEGEAAAKARDYAKAHQILTRAWEMNPSSVRALRARGAIFLAENKVAEAQGFFDLAVKLDPADPKTLSGIGMCEMMQKNPGNAYKYFVKALGIDPFQLVTILQLLECSYLLSKFDDLERVLRHYVEKHPLDMEIQYCHAGALYKLGKANEAMTVVNRVLATNPSHLGAKQLKDVIAEEAASAAAPQTVTVPPLTARIEKTSDSATIDSLKKAAERHVDPTEERAQIRLSELEEMKRMKELGDARRGCEEFIRQNGASPVSMERAKVLLAEISVLENKLPEAEVIYDEVLTANAKHARALCGKGALSAHRNDWTRAQQYFEEAHAADARSDVAWAGLGLCSSWAKNQYHAWDCYSKALEINPENSRALLGVIELGYPLRKLGEVERHIRTYLDLHPADLDFIYSLAGCYFAQDKLDEAIEELDRLALFTPHSKNALELREMITNKMKWGTALSAGTK